MSAWELIENTSEYTETGELVEGEVFREIFSPKEKSEVIEEQEIIGTPEEDAQYWHLQEHPMSCAVASQEFVAEGLLKEDFSEAKMREFASDQEWFSENGTSIEDTGNILEAMGLEVTKEYGQTVEDIGEVLESEGKVIVGVNNLVLEDENYAMIPGMSANHAVEVIGIDTSDPEKIEVILNDPGVENGAGRRCDLETFQKAWQTSDCFMVSAYRR